MTPDTMSSSDVGSQENDDVWKVQARDLINEDPSLTDQRIEEMKELLKNEPNLKIPDDREFYLKFLRAGLSDPKVGVDIIKNFFKLKTKGDYFKVANFMSIVFLYYFLFQECNRFGQTGQDDIQPADSLHASTSVMK